MTHINPDKRAPFLFERSNTNVMKKPTRLLNARLNSSKKIMRTRPQAINAPITIKNDYDNTDDDLNNKSNHSFHASRSLKEFSYFDWSKVKLYKDEYRVHEANPNNIFHPTDLSLIRTVRTGGGPTAKSSFDILQQQSNELPQVVTIRFT